MIPVSLNELATMTEAVQPLSIAQPQATQQASCSRSESCKDIQKDSANQCPPIKDFLDVSTEELRASFHDIWSDATSDHQLTLFGFRRYRTIQLVNLRYLELEVEKISHLIFQAGLQLDQAPSQLDLLGLRYVKKKPGAPTAVEVINNDTILRLRKLIKEYSL